MTLSPNSTAGWDRRRSSFIAALIKAGLEHEQRWDEVESALGALPDSGHEWDDNPSAWVRSQRQGDARRSG